MYVIYIYMYMYIYIIKSTTMEIRPAVSSIPIGSMVLLYMVCHGSHQYTPVMLAFFYQHHGSVMGYKRYNSDNNCSNHLPFLIWGHDPAISSIHSWHVFIFWFHTNSRCCSENSLWQADKALYKHLGGFRPWKPTMVRTVIFPVASQNAF